MNVQDHRSRYTRDYTPLINGKSRNLDNANDVAHPFAPLRSWALWLLLVLYLAVASLYFVTVPPLEGFDAAAHMNDINYWRQAAPRLPPTLPPIDAETTAFSYELITQPPLYYAVSALATSWLPYADADHYVRESANRYFPGLSTRQSIDLPFIPLNVERAMTVARLMALLGGVTAVVATWLWIHSALSARAHQKYLTQWSLPMAVTAVVAFNPLFLFMTTSITNDAWATAGTILIVWLMTAAASHRAQRWWIWFGIGAVAGCVALTKYNGLLAAVPALVILLQYQYHHRWGQFAKVAALLFGGALLTAGGWYGRNLWLYGEPVPFTAMSTVITTLQRPTLMTPAEVWALLPFIFYAYWGLFVAIFAPDRFFDAVRWAVLLGVVGLPLWFYRRRQQKALMRVLWLALIWFGLNLVSMVNYMRLISYGEQARFLLPAAPALALLLVCGWQAWGPTRVVPFLRWAVLPAMLLLALWPLPTLRTAYATPPATPAVAAMRPVDAHFVDGINLVGYAMPNGAALAPNSSLPVTLYFTAEQAISDDYTLFLHLVDQDDQLIYQYDGVPFAGRHPTRQWQPGVVFADTYEVTRPLELTNAMLAGPVATLIVGFYRYEDPTARLAVYDDAGNAVGDRLVLGEVRLLPAGQDVAMDKPSATLPLATWEPGIELVNAAVPELSHGTIGPVPIELTWQTTALLTEDYTVFLQFLDGEGAVVAQIDQEPQAGAAPTSTWLVNEPILDSYTLTPPPTWQQLIVGLYNARTGQRLTLTAPSAGADFLVLRRQD